MVTPSSGKPVTILTTGGAGCLYVIPSVNLQLRSCNCTHHPRKLHVYHPGFLMSITPKKQNSPLTPCTKIMSGTCICSCHIITSIDLQLLQQRMDWRHDIPIRLPQSWNAGHHVCSNGRGNKFWGSTWLKKTHGMPWDTLEIWWFWRWFLVNQSTGLKSSSKWLNCNSSSNVVFGVVVGINKFRLLMGACNPFPW